MLIIRVRDGENNRLKRNTKTKNTKIKKNNGAQKL